MISDTKPQSAKAGGKNKKVSKRETKTHTKTVDNKRDPQSAKADGKTKKASKKDTQSAKADGKIIKESNRIDKAENLNIWYTNADSLPNKIDELKTRITASEQTPNVIIIVEAKPKNQRFEVTVPELGIEGYNISHKNMELGQGRGIIVYTDSELILNEITLKTGVEENLNIDIKLKNSLSLIVSIIYRSPNSTTENNLKLLEAIEEIDQTKCDHKMIIGDFNLPKIEWESLGNESGYEKEFVECISNCYLHQHINSPTRARGTNNPSTIDLVLTNDHNNISNIETTSPLGKSDHSLIKIVTNFETTSDNSNKPKKYIYNKGNYSEMEEGMNINWKDHLENKTTQEKWDTFQEKIHQNMEAHIPKRAQHPRRKNLPKIDPKLLSKIKRKNRLWHRYVETKEFQKYKEFTKLRNQIRNDTRRSRKATEKEIANDIKSNPKAFWSYVNSKTKSKSGIANLEYQRDGVSHLTSTDKEKTEVLSEFFTSVFTKEPEGQIPKLKNEASKYQIQKLTITEEIVGKKLKNLNPNKSPGMDEIHPRILKELAEILKAPLCDIYSKSLNEGKLPQQWKAANISAIFKKGKKKQPNNYRPVSLTSVPCKIMESIIRDHIKEHMKNNKLFSPKQFGFIEGRSTSLQLLVTLEEWTKILDEGGSVGAVYMDFMKAFDTVPHKRLLGKLEHYGIKGETLKWIEDFLNGRKQRVTIGSEKSDWRPVTSGIPQGSVLGPLLFVVYINDLPCDLETNVLMFADDTKLYSRVAGREDVDAIQRDLDRLDEWSRIWLLRFHPDKCKILKVSKKPTIEINLHLYSNDEQHSVVNLSSCEDEKDIGVFIDDKLNFEKHIKTKTGKANQIMGIIRRTFSFMNESIFKQLFKTLVRPHIEYANSVWAPYKLENIRKIESVQRRATKLIPGFKDMEYEDRLRKLDLPTLYYRRKRGDMIETYKIMNGIYDSDVSPKLEKAPNIRGTRGHEMKLFKKGARTEARKNFFTHRIVEDWNELPQEVINAETTNAFKNRLDKAWAENSLKYTPI